MLGAEENTNLESLFDKDLSKYAENKYVHEAGVSYQANGENTSIILGYVQPQRIGCLMNKVFMK